MIIILQVLLVTGGVNGDSGRLDSTEVLEDNTWKMSAPLPSARNGLQAASVANTIFVFGKNILYYYLNIYFHSSVCLSDISVTSRIQSLSLVSNWFPIVTRYCSLIGQYNLILFSHWSILSDTVLSLVNIF